MSKLLDRILKNKNFLESLRGSGLADDIVSDFLYNQAVDVKSVLKNKKYIKSLKGTALMDDLVEEYVDNAIPLKTRPKSNEKTNYIGIEFECFSSYDRGEMLEKFIEHNLEDIVDIGEDSSICADFGDEYELRFLLKEKELKKQLARISKVIKKGKFGVNDSCGLHIHLDMRNRDVEKCYERLLKFQDVMFSMVNSDRWNNEYCKYNRPGDSNGHYTAINKDDAYADHRTIEIRLHHATMDMNQIEKWISLLLTIIGTKNPPPLDTKAKILNWAKDKRSLKAYIAKNFDSEWLETEKIASEA